MADRLAARTPGAKRAGPGEYVFNLANVNHILGGPDYSTANGSCVEGDRMIVGLMRMPAGTGAAPHSHPNLRSTPPPGASPSRTSTDSESACDIAPSQAGDAW